ncbi:MAG: corrinoid protein [Thermoleophilia bacterium]|nr:corrinoid protein [Thermoleophilia bacterium]
MATDERTQQLISGLYEAVVSMDEDTARELSQTAVDEGVDAYFAIANGLTAAMEKVGELYTTHVYFVPELLLCADALYAGLDILRPHIKSSDTQNRRRLIIGTVEGDIHDIGKNLVRVMFEAASWEVVDLGRDVQLKRFAEEQERFHAHVVALSALMTTSMLAMPKAIEMIKGVDDNVAVLVGGAPLSRSIAESYGADGYAPDAGQAVQEANRILSLRA